MSDWQWYQTLYQLEEPRGYALAVPVCVPDDDPKRAKIAAEIIGRWQEECYGSMLVRIAERMAEQQEKEAE